MTLIQYLYIELSEMRTNINKHMTFRDLSDGDCICWVKEFFLLFHTFLSLLLNEFLQSEIMQKSRSVQNIANIIADADE